MNFPEGFQKILQQSLPKEDTERLLEALQTQSEVSVRINRKKLHSIKKSGIDTAAWNPDVYYLKERHEFAADPGFHGGLYYVQEASSAIMGPLVAELLGHCNHHALVLDLCAAPGGKSTAIAAALRYGDLLVANEIIHSRTPILHENLCKWGHSNHIITRADAKQFGNADARFDIIVADMPCSGEGMFRKDPQSRNEWSVNNVQLCSRRQQSIALDVWPALKPGGFFIYSTCTFNAVENEQNIQFLQKITGADIWSSSLAENSSLYSAEPGMYRMMPGFQRGEGLFFAILRKPEVDEKLSGKMVRKQGYEINRKMIPVSDECCSYIFRDIYYFLHHPGFEMVSDLLLSLPAVYAPGTPAGRYFQKKNSQVFKPEPELALSLFLQAHSFPEISLNDSDIIKYLMRESIRFSDSKEGVHTITWNAMLIGFVNGIGMQGNNLWPMAWRLRKAYPEARALEIFSFSD